MIQGLKERKYDIAFCSKMDNEPLIEFTPVAKQELVLIVPKEHPLESKTSIDLKESLAYPHIVFSKRSGLRKVMINYLKNVAATRRLLIPWRKIRVLPDLSVPDLVLLSFRRCRFFPTCPVSIIEIATPSWERLFYMATLKNVYQAPVVMNFKKYVTEHAEV